MNSTQTIDTQTIETKLEGISRRLEEQGKGDLAQEIKEVVGLLRRPSEGIEPPGGVITTGEAARMLGVRSINTVKRWAREGLLEGFRRGGRIVISRRSVERMLQSPEVAEQRTLEAELAASLEPLGTEEEIPSVLPWTGRKPWAKDADGRC